MAESEYYGEQVSKNELCGFGGGTTSVHVTALDGVVNVNSLFTVAVFVGLAVTSSSSPENLSGDLRCIPGPSVPRSLVALEVASFSSFLFSSLVAQALKLAVNLLSCRRDVDPHRAHIDSRVLRLGMMAAAAGSALGCVFLVLSMVQLVQVRLGTLACGSTAAMRAVVGLVVPVAAALLFYVSTVFYTFTH